MMIVARLLRSKAALFCDIFLLLVLVRRGAVGRGREVGRGGAGDPEREDSFGVSLILPFARVIAIRFEPFESQPSSTSLVRLLRRWGGEW